MNKSGFTLVELMVVIAIIAILAVGSVTVYDSYLAKAYTSRMISDAIDINRRMSLCLDGVGMNCIFSERSCTGTGGLSWGTGRLSGIGVDDYVADCAESDGGLGGCNSEVSWDDAREVCESAGARLCTRDEIYHGYGVGTGCGHDARMIWTMSICNEGKGFVAVQGNVNRGGTDEICETDIFNPSGKGVRCCSETH